MRAARAGAFWRVILGGFLLGLSLGLLRDHAMGSGAEPGPMEVPVEVPAPPGADTTCATPVASPAPPCRDTGLPTFAV